MICLPHDVSEEFDDVAHAGNMDGPEDTEVVARVPVSSLDSPQEDAMGNFEVAIFDTVSFSGWSDTATTGVSDDELFHSITSAEMDSEALSLLSTSPG